MKLYYNDMFFLVYGTNMWFNLRPQNWDVETKPLVLMDDSDQVHIVYEDTTSHKFVSRLMNR